MTLAGWSIGLLSRALALLPGSWMAGLSRPLAAAGWHLAKSRRRVTLTNLRLCFPEWSEAERERVARAHFRAYVQAALEHGLLWHGSAERIRRFVTVHGEEHWRPFYDESGRSPRPIIWLSPHFVGLDATAIRVSMEVRGCTLYSRQSDPGIDEIVRRGRARWGTVELYPRHEGVKPVIRALRRGVSLYYLPDMDFGARESVFVPFFGVPAATITALSRLVRLSNAVVVPVVATQRPRGGGYDVQFYPPFTDFPSGDEVADARRVNAFIEERVREQVAQYLWSHRRFKTRPPGEASVY